MITILLTMIIFIIFMKLMGKETTQNLMIMRLDVVILAVIILILSALVAEFIINYCMW